MSIDDPIDDWMKQPELLDVSPEPINIEHMTPLEAMRHINEVSVETFPLGVFRNWKD